MRLIDWVKSMKQFFGSWYSDIDDSWKAMLAEHDAKDH